MRMQMHTTYAHGNPCLGSQDPLLWNGKLNLCMQPKLDRERTGHVHLLYLTLPVGWICLILMQVSLRSVRLVVTHHCLKVKASSFSESEGVNFLSPSSEGECRRGLIRLTVFRKRSPREIIHVTVFRKRG